MSSANEELHHPPPHQQTQQKPRVSPLEFRNTDLVSRLLAATPPYLYNMPLVPHTYFFSEMLRSFVQAKTGGGGEAANNPQRTQSLVAPRRTRKRSWTNVSYQHKQEQLLQAKLEAAKEMPPPPPATPNWPPKMYLDKNHPSSIFDKPLELTMNKKEENLISFAPQTAATDLPPQNSQTADQMVLPPPPPLWYPPLYPPGGSYPSTFDPLHFFIDLRVSGHIYDRKGATKDERGKEDIAQNASPLGYFKQSRHSSAFSVPGGQNNGGGDTAAGFPINLTNNTNGGPGGGDVKMKFDVKSMGFDKLDNNKTSTNYIMQNIDGIYKNIGGASSGNEEPSSSSAKNEEEEMGENDEDKKKGRKDLRALIGLELVVDYMSSRKKNHPLLLQKCEEAAEETVAVEGLSKVDEDSASRNSSGSPAVEVVSVSENDGFVYN